MRKGINRLERKGEGKVQKNRKKIWNGRRKKNNENNSKNGKDDKDIEDKLIAEVTMVMDKKTR